MKTKLITSYQVRMERIQHKRHAVLRFLRTNLFTTAEVIGLLLGISSRQGVHTTLKAMRRDGLVRKETVEAHGRKWVLWGITSHGQAMAFDPESGERPERKYFEMGRVGLTVLAHTLDLQRLHIKAGQSGWTNWLFGDRLDKWQPGMSRPDAIASCNKDIRYALECERTIKTVKRYESILSDRLQAIRRGEFDCCLWLCPTREEAVRLRAIIVGIEEVLVAGSRVKIQERHRASLSFAAYGDFPSRIGE